jgi:hypothetical protein
MALIAAPVVSRNSLPNQEVLEAVNYPDIFI